MFKWYMNRLVTHPVTTNSIGSGFIASTGDMLCQTYQKWDLEPIPKEERKWHELGGKVDLRRSFIQWSFSTFLGTPFFVNVYRVLDKLLPTKSIPNAFKKGAGTWFVATSMTPIFFTYATVVSNIVLHDNKHLSARQHWKACKKKVTQELPRTAVYSLAFWSPNWIPIFYLMPPHVRILYASFINVMWQSIMSGIQHNSKQVVADATSKSNTNNSHSRNDHEGEEVTAETGAHQIAALTITSSVKHHTASGGVKAPSMVA